MARTMARADAPPARSPREANWLAPAKTNSDMAPAWAMLSPVWVARTTNAIAMGT